MATHPSQSDRCSPSRGTDGAANVPSVTAVGSAPALADGMIALPGGSFVMGSADRYV